MGEISEGKEKSGHTKNGPAHRRDTKVSTGLGGHMQHM